MSLPSLLLPAWPRALFLPKQHGQESFPRLLHPAFPLFLHPCVGEPERETASKGSPTPFQTTCSRGPAWLPCLTLNSHLLLLLNPISDSSHNGLPLPALWFLLPLSAAIVSLCRCGPVTKGNLLPTLAQVQQLGNHLPSLIKVRSIYLPGSWST